MQTADKHEQATLRKERKKISEQLAETNAYEEKVHHLADQMIEINYEDLVSDQEGQSRRLLAFLGLPWDNTCLDFHQTQRVVHTASTTQVRQPIYRNAVGRWHACAEYLGPLLEALGDLAR